MVAIVQMMERMKDMATERNSEIADYHGRCMGESSRLLLEGDNVGAAVVISLSPQGFRLWSEEFEQSKLYVKKAVDGNPGQFQVQRLGTSAPPRLVQGLSSRCDCEYRISMLAQCRHEICAFGFRLDLFGKRYHQNSCLAVSAVKAPVFEDLANSTAVPDEEIDDINRNVIDGGIVALDDSHEDDGHLDNDGEAEDDANFDNKSDAGLQQYDSSQRESQSFGPNAIRTIQKATGTKSKDDFRNFMDITNGLWDVVRSREDVNRVCGVLLKLTDFTRTKQINSSMSCDEWLDSHLSAFASHRESNDLFSQINFNDASGANLTLVPRSGKSTGPTSKMRLKPNVELLQGRRQKPKCTFCKQPSHRITTCPTITELQARQVKDASIAFHLGDPGAHQVLSMPTALAASLKNHDWETSQVPLDAVHVVINVVYKDPCDVGTRNAHRDPQESIVDATFLGDSGRPVRVNVEGATPQLYKAKFVRQWITRKSQKRMIFTKLLPPANNIMNDYVYTKY